MQYVKGNKDIMEFLESVIFLIGLLTFVWFLLPLFAHGIMNVGNATGIVGGFVVMIYACQMSRINGWFEKAWNYNYNNTNIGRITISAIGIGVVIGIGLVLLLTSCMVIANRKKPKENATVIVLGCRVYGERPSLMLMERLDAAYDFLIDNTDSMCIVSGGQGIDEDISEAECMYRYLTDKGINPERLFKEERSTSTRENLIYSKEIMDRNKLNQYVAIVTNEFHEYRAGKIAKTLGIEYSAVPSRTAWWLLPTYYVRELYAIFFERVFYLRERIKTGRSL